MSNRLLDGVRILDLSRMLAGPYAGMLLCDLGNRHQCPQM